MGVVAEGYYFFLSLRYEKPQGDLVPWLEVWVNQPESISILASHARLCAGFIKTCQVHLVMMYVTGIHLLTYVLWWIYWAFYIYTSALLWWHAALINNNDKIFKYSYIWIGNRAVKIIYGIHSRFLALMKINIFYFLIY